MRAYLRSLNPNLPRDVWILQAGGLANMFGNGVIGPFLIIYLHNVRGISLGVAGLVVASNSAAGGFVLQAEPLALWPAVAGICLLASGYALALEGSIPQRLRRTPHVGSVAGVPGTMPNMALTTDDPLSTDAEPAPHPEDAASRLRRGGRPAPGTTRR